VTVIAPTLQAFFTDRLMTQLQASPHTIAAYRDTVRLLLGYTQQRSGKNPANLDFTDLDAPLIGAFLTHLETDRNNSITTRNTRLTAIHSLFRYAALRVPEHAALIARVLAIPAKRHNHPTVCFLTRDEISALLATPNTSTWTGRRDHALLLVAVQTGLRVSELTGLTINDIELGTGPHLRCRGKGRKDRCTPLTRQTVDVLREWLTERGGTGTDPAFPTRRGTPLSRDAVERLVTKYAQIAANTCPSLAGRTITPHVLRHSAAMALLHSGVDITVIALWLGHESPATTRVYLHADMAMKQQALARTTPPDSQPGRYTPPDTLLAFLDTL
jgi:site-specific recombinase XerD